MRVKMLIVSVLGIGLGLLFGSASPAGSQEPVPQSGCSYQTVDENGISLSAYDPESQADRVIVERSVNGGRWWWRGRIDPLVQGGFQDELRAGTRMEYRVRGIVDGVSAEPFDCGVVDLTEVIPPVEICSVDVDLNGRVVVTIPQTRQIYQSWVVSRSVDGARAFWRGRIDSFGRFEGYFEDTLRPGLPTQYFVEAVAADGRRSEAVACGEPVMFEYSPPPAPTCQTNLAGLAGFQVTTSGERIVVYRSVDGGPQHWRDSISNLPSYSEPDDQFSLGRQYDYFFESVGPTGLRSERAYCATYTIVQSGASLRGVPSFDGLLAG